MDERTDKPLIKAALDVAALRTRRRRVQGFAFRSHTPAEMDAIRKFIETGDETGLPERYRR